MLGTHMGNLLGSLFENIYEEVHRGSDLSEFSMFVKWRQLWHKAWNFWFHRILEFRGKCFVKWLARRKISSLSSCYVVSSFPESRKDKDTRNASELMLHICTESVVRFYNLTKFSLFLWISYESGNDLRG